MLVRTAILTPILYLLILWQGSFLPHFAVFGYVPNLAFIFIALFIFFVPSLSLGAAFLGGVFLDIFSSHFFGFNVLIFLGIVFFTKFIFRRYVQVSF